MHTNAFDYRSKYVLRTDPTYPPAAWTAFPAQPDPGAIYAGILSATLPVIEGIWSQISPDPDALANMLALLTRFSDQATSNGFTTWDSIPKTLIESFVHEANPALSDDVSRLRKNSVQAAYLALADAGLHHQTSTAVGIDPVPGKVRADERGKHKGNAKPKAEKLRRSYSNRPHTRPASHDEILLVRLACRLATTTRTRHLPAAAVAICSSSAAASEAPQVLWSDAHGECIDLAGRPAEDGRDETAIAPRRITMDSWSAQALSDWRQERSGPRPVHGNDPILYNGNQALTSVSAQASVHQQVEKALNIADLRREPGLTPGSLRLWAAARHVSDFPDLTTGAAIAGVEPFTLHRHITQQGERGLRLNS